MKPLIAAEATTFVLIQKLAKNQDKKILPPTGKTPRPALFVRPLPTFDHGSIKVSLLKKLGEVFPLPVSRTASDEIRQNDGGLVQWQGIADFYRRAKARCVATAE